MRHLKRINQHFYSHFDRNTRMLFTLKRGDRGVYGMGKAWYLSVTYGDSKQTIATFTVQDDGHKCYKDDYLGMLWNEGAVFSTADEMVGKMLIS